MGIHRSGSLYWGARGHFAMSSFTGTRENQYSNEAHFHLDCKVNSRNFRLWSHGKPDVVVEVLFYLIQEQNLVHEQ